MTLPTSDRLAYPINDAARAVGISRSRIYELLATGELHAVKHGRRTLVPRESLERYLASLPPYEPGDGP